MQSVFQQLDSGVRFDWGLAGAQNLQTPDGCMVVVDVLSFTTTVSIAVSRGMIVFPYPWKNESASAFAVANDAVLAVGRSEATQQHPWSLSGSSILEAPVVPRLVLPSPNGSAIASASTGLTVASSLRNGNAVARWLLANGFGLTDKPVAIIAAGEKWEIQGAIRPASEDLLGAGLLAAALIDGGCNPSVEAQLAAAAYKSTTDTARAVLDCASGRELRAAGYQRDVELAVAVDADDAVPVMDSDAFTAAVV